ncbi:MAG: exodeoxyribonuclease V subunit alpha [Colwellia sp.]
MTDHSYLAKQPETSSAANALCKEAQNKKEQEQVLLSPYGTFYQASVNLCEIEAIDYFFANEVNNALLAYLQQGTNKLQGQQETSMEAEVCQAKNLSLSLNLLRTHSECLWHVFAALSQCLRQGNTCLSVAKLALVEWGKDDSHKGYLFKNEETLETLFEQLHLNEHNSQLVVYRQGKLYMRRYFQFEQELKDFITSKLDSPCRYPIKHIASTVSSLFPDDQALVNEIDWQKLAVANALKAKFSIIAGGPGTGKTYTVTKLLAAILMLNIENQNQKMNKDLKQTSSVEIALTAPTGKAAQRLRESLEKSLHNFKGTIGDDILSLIPTNAKTLHRLLGVIPNSPNFKHNQHNLLTCDILLIDEVSMVDLPMMTRVFRALKPTASVILLGDADQLPSVAVGSVLADLAPSPHPGYSKENLNYLIESAGISKACLTEHSLLSENLNINFDYLSFLLKSRRFDGEGAIGKMAKAVIQGHVDASWALLKENEVIHDTCTEYIVNQPLTLVNHDLTSWLKPLVDAYYQGISMCKTVNDAFEQLSKFRILCVMRVGEFGVDAINQWVKDYLAGKQNIRSNSFDATSTGEAQRYYHGLPIMITQNNYRMNLFNGDIGLMWLNADNRLVAYFEQASEKNETQVDKQEMTSPKTVDTQYKQFLPSRLPSFEAVYAMTIHKTQGSEFEHVALIVPNTAISKQNNKQDNQLLSRELLYTGITRAKQRLTIATQKANWQQGVKSKINRDSGLGLSL